MEGRQSAGTAVRADEGDRIEQHECDSRGHAGDKLVAAVDGVIVDMTSISHGYQNTCYGVEGTLEGGQWVIVAELVSKRGQDFEMQQALATYSLGVAQQLIAAGQIGLLNSSKLKGLAAELNGEEDATHGE